MNIMFNTTRVRIHFTVHWVDDARLRASDRYLLCGVRFSMRCKRWYRVWISFKTFTQPARATTNVENHEKGSRMLVNSTVWLCVLFYLLRPKNMMHWRLHVKCVCAVFLSLSLSFLLFFSCVPFFINCCRFFFHSLFANFSCSWICFRLRFDVYEGDKQKARVNFISCQLIP